MLCDRDAEERHDPARAQLTAILAEAADRREKLQTQHAMADALLIDPGRNPVGAEDLSCVVAYGMKR